PALSAGTSAEGAVERGKHAIQSLSARTIELSYGASVRIRDDDLRLRGRILLQVIVDDERFRLVRHRQVFVAGQVIVHVLIAETVARARLDVEQISRSVKDLLC